jgi:hypothetical protein
MMPELASKDAKEEMQTCSTTVLKLDQGLALII